LIHIFLLVIEYLEQPIAALPTAETCDGVASEMKRLCGIWRKTVPQKVSDLREKTLHVSLPVSLGWRLLIHP